MEAWYDDLATRRLGRDTADLRWTVRRGIASSDFLAPGDPTDWATFSQRLDAWLTARGCPLIGAWDKVVVAAPTVDLQEFGGRYFDRGLIAVHSAADRYLLAREPGHSFGADDPYLALGGRTHWSGDLMGNDLAAPPLPGDGVLWGETGFADLERSHAMRRSVIRVSRSARPAATSCRITDIASTAVAMAVASSGPRARRDGRSQSNRSVQRPRRDRLSRGARQ